MKELEIVCALFDKGNADGKGEQKMINIFRGREDDNGLFEGKRAFTVKFV